MNHDLFPEDEEEVKDEKEKVITYHCNMCDTTFSAPKSLMNVSCVYCGSKNASTIESYNYSDYKILPFVFTMNDAKKAYQSKIRFNPLLPKIFHSKKSVISIKKVYLPCLLYNANTSGKATFLGADKIKNIQNIPKQTFEAQYDVKVDYDNILVCGYSKIADEMLNSVNKFNYSVLEDYKEDSLRDTYLIPFDEDEKTITDELEEKIVKCSLSIVRSNVEHQLKKLKENKIKISKNTKQKVLVPIYFTKISYKDVDYLFIMNAHSGDVAFDLVSSKVSLAIFSISFFLILMILLIGIALVL